MNADQKKEAILNIMKHVHHYYGEDKAYNQLYNHMPEYMINYGQLVVFRPNDDFPYNSLSAIKNLSSSLSEEDFIKVLNHKNWKTKELRVLDMVYYRIQANLHSVIQSLSRVNHPYLDLVFKYAEGAVLRTAILAIPDYRSEPLINKALKSKDYKIRKFAVKICHVNKLSPLIKDPNKAVRKEVIKRLGANNIAEKLLEDKDISIRLKAATFLRRQDVAKNIFPELMERLEAEIKQCKNSTKVFRAEVKIAQCLDLLDIKELPFYLDAKNISPFLAKFIEDKLAL